MTYLHEEAREGSNAEVRNPAELAQELAHRARFLRQLALRQLEDERVMSEPKAWAIDISLVSDFSSEVDDQPGVVRR